MDTGSVEDRLSDVREAPPQRGDASAPSVRVLIVAEHASLRFGGEAALPLHYFRVLRQRREPAWLIVHERTRDELHQHFPDEEDRIFYIRDTWLHRALWWAGRVLPQRLAYFTFGMVARWVTQVLQRRLARRMIAEQGIDVVHQPIPVSPREPSMLFNLGVPVVIGPMNGGIDYPPAFADLQRPWVTVMMRAGRWCADLLNTLIPGKRRAATLLVANARTHRALPAGMQGRIVELVENGVDLRLWRPSTKTARERNGPTRFVYIGRLVDWKAVDILLDAFAAARQKTHAHLEIIGGGPEAMALQAHATRLGLLSDGAVTFTGFLPQPQCARRLQEADVLVLPSLMECGGAVVLEAMAMALPVIATDWGGPADYLDSSCGILIEPRSRPAMVEQLTAAMVRLSESPELRTRMGQAGRERVEQSFDWDAKVQRMLDIYREAVQRSSAAKSG